MDTKGGRFSLQINGVTYTGRGNATIIPARAEPDADANSNGSAYRWVTPKLAEIGLDFDRGVGIVWDENLLLQDVDLTFVETDAGVTHLLTDAGFTGRGEIKVEKGEVTGLKLKGDQYQAVFANR
jgi:Phage tail tube protein